MSELTNQEKEDHVVVAKYFLEEFLSQHTPRGVMHLGAHTAQEADTYRSAGFARMLWVEANPTLALDLGRRFAGDPAHHTVHAAVSDVTGTRKLMIHTSRTGSVEPASLLPLKEFKEKVSTLTTPKEVSVPAFRLDDLVKHEGLNARDYNFLVLDIQGAELQALKGATGTLEVMDAVQVEVGLIEMYEGGSNERDVTDALGKLGFRLAKTLVHELYEMRDGAKHYFPAWAELYYSR